MFCNKCGNIVESGTNKCSHCNTSYKKMDYMTLEEENKLIKRKLKKEAKRIKKLELKAQREKRHPFKIILSIFVFVLLVTTIAGGTGLWYMNKYAFTNDFNYMTMSSYLYKNNFDKVKLLKNGDMKIRLSEDCVNTYINDYIRKNSSEFKNVENLTIDLNSRRVKTNFISSMGVVPISGRLDLKISEGKIYLNLDDYQLGEGNIDIPSFISDLILGWVKGYEAELNQLSGDNEYFNVKYVEMIDGEVEVTVKPNLTEALTKINDRVKSLDEGIILVYDEIKDQGNESYSLISNIYHKGLDEHSLTILLNDIFGEQKYIKDLLIALNLEDIHQIFQDYSKLIKNDLSEKSVLVEKSRLLLDMKIAVDDFYLERLVNYIQNKNLTLLSDNGLLYDFRNEAYVTIKDINEYFADIKPYYLEESKNMQYAFDAERGEYFVIHKLNSVQYLVLKSNRYEVLTLDDAEEKYPQIRGQVTHSETKLVYKEDEERAAITEAIRRYWLTDESIYYRRLVTDGQYAHAFLSFGDDFQSIHTIALKKTMDKWEIIGINLAYEAMNAQDPNFNIKLFPKYTLNDIYVKTLGDWGIKAMADQLKIDGIYSKRSNVTMDYCSYIGNYVYMLMSDEKEFIIKVDDNATLTQVLPRDEAEKEWELPPLLTLQH